MDKTSQVKTELLMKQWADMVHECRSNGLSKGAEASALCFSMIETAKLNNLNVYGYLIYLLSELPKLGEKPTAEQLKKLLP